MTVDEGLASARAAGLDRLDAQLLLAHLTGRTRAWLLAHGDVALEADARARLPALIARRAAGEPLAYLVGMKEFHGLELRVDARVLVPRPETELLVDWALELLRGELAGLGVPAVVDLGTGSGAIALATKQAFPAAEVLATDLSTDALVVARANAARLGLDIAFVSGAWWQAAAGRRFDLALSNPPYVAANDDHLPALRHEPMAALTPGSSGMEAFADLVAAAPEHLRPGGWLLLEHGHDQAEQVSACLVARGFSRVTTRHDLAGHPRCTGGKL